LNGDIASAYSSSTPVLNVGNAQVLEGLHGFLVSGSSYTTIDFPAALATIAYGLNDNGFIVGVYANPDGTVHGFVRMP